MQNHQAHGDKNFVQSPAMVVNCAEQEFTSDRRTAEIVPEEGKEFIQRLYSPRGVVLLYFRGDSEVEVDKHFHRSFAELCCLPGGSEISMDDSHFQGRPSLPMSQRNLPASFWHQSHTNQFQQPQSSVSHQSNTVNKHQQTNDSKNHCNNRHHRFTSQHDFLQQDTPNLVRARAIAVPHVKLPAGTFTTFTPGITQQTSSHSCRTSTSPFLQEFPAHCNNSHNSVRFNPGYNALLIEPEVKPRLPAVPGEPRAKLNGSDKIAMESFPGEILTRARNGEN